MRRFLPFLVIALVGLATLAAAAFWLHSSSRDASGPISIETGERHVRGPAKAKATVEVFADFESERSAELQLILQKLDSEFPGNLRVVFRHRPLPDSPRAQSAAAGAEAAGLQGKFWEMHDVLYAERNEWRQAPEVSSVLLGYARRLGLDESQFQNDQSSPAVNARLLVDQKEALKGEVQESPAVFVNGRRISAENLNETGLREAVRVAIRSKVKRRK